MANITKMSKENKNCREKREGCYTYNTNNKKYTKITIRTGFSPFDKST